MPSHSLERGEWTARYSPNEAGMERGFDPPAHFSIVPIDHARL